MKHFKRKPSTEIQLIIKIDDMTIVDADSTTLAMICHYAYNNRLDLMQNVIVSPHSNLQVIVTPKRLPK